jgi:TctA family transporter
MAWPAFGYMLLGIAIIGFWVGLLPGIGGLVHSGADAAVFLFHQRSVSAFAFLLGMLAVTGTTGDLTSILFGIPGEGSSAALILDGYPMSKNGEAGRALGAAIMSSVGRRYNRRALSRTLDSDHAPTRAALRFP